MSDLDWILKIAIEAAEVRLGPLWPMVQTEASKQIGYLVNCAEYIDEHSSYIPDDQARSMFNIHQQALLEALSASDPTDGTAAPAAVAAVVQVIKSNIPLPVSIFDTP